MLSISTILSLFLALWSLNFASAAPIPHASRRSVGRRLATRGPAGVGPSPHFVIYGNEWANSNGPPPVDQLKGYDGYMLSFWTTKGAQDKAAQWQNLAAADRAQIKQAYQNAGVKLMVSLFGDQDLVTTQGDDPVATANSVADWVQQYDIDGVDIDYEDFGAMDARNGKAEQWVIDFTKTLRGRLPQGQYAISHAPVAPWFARGPNAGYLMVHNAVGDLIDWYNVQFYNQGAGAYESCDTLLNKASNVPGTSVFELAGLGIPLQKIVIGKPGQASDAPYHGYIDPNTLATCLQQAKDKGWNAGTMVWQFGSVESAWVQTVRSQSWPV